MVNMKLSRAIETLLLAAVVIVSVSIYPLRPVGAISNTPTYVLGVSNPLDPLILDLKNLTSSVTILPSPSSLSLLSANSILFVDGAWLSSASSLDPTILSLLVGTVLQGVPTVTVRGNAALIADSVSGLLKWHPQSLPLISEGLFVAGTLPDGSRRSAILQVITGFDYAVQNEFNWAQQQISNTATLFPSTAPLSTSLNARKLSVTPQANASATPAPYWLSLGYFSISTGNYFYPYGIVTTTSEVYILKNSGSTAYTWYNFFLNQTVQPGISAFKNDWRTDILNSLVHITNTTSNMIVSHGPIGTINAGPFTESYTIGVTAGSQNATVTSSQTQTYSLKNTNVTDTSHPPDVSWIHNINTRTSSGTLTFQVIPGWTDRIIQGSGSRPSFQLFFATTFAELQGNNVANTQTETFSEVVGS
jgi:hypothetical protein